MLWCSALRMFSLLSLKSITQANDQNIFQRAAADNILRDLKANPDTWLQVTHILQNTRSTHTKYFALQVSLVNLLIYIQRTNNGYFFEGLCLL